MDLSSLQQIDVYTFVPWAINVGLALAVFIIGRLATKLLVSFARKIMKRAEFDEILINFLASILKALLLLAVVIAAIDQLGVETTSLVALVGAAGLAVGLALQDSLKNFASGVMLVIFRPFKVGDYVEAAGNSGSVEKINIFSTVLNTPDNKEIIVPNGTIFSDTIINYSANATRRVDFVFGIGYDDDLRAAKSIIGEILDQDDKVMSDPPAQIVIGELADSSVNIVVRAWAKTEDYWDVFFRTVEQVKLTFDERGISIPYPQMDVHTGPVAVNDQI